MKDSHRATSWVVATGNAGKLSELRRLLAGFAPRLLGLADVGPVALPPEGDEYAANALAKARAVAAATNLPAVADDSGLEVDALGGRPGAASARYGGAEASDAERVARLLRELADVPDARRTARFVCVLAFVTPEGDAIVVRGTCEGRILRAPQGAAGFGYDPVFVPHGAASSMAQLSPDEKNAISHRAMAIAALRSALARAAS
ncbi:MAG: RdgB/HAM1 family non-canonical purine NTP pyrophosphatase [Deltaproteobacteria bacterium]|nr:RdgB/HAM1 family non-canonical purine NTP pyrophosphatase [Deltaproteobacteria bacterium]